MNVLNTCRLCRSEMEQATPINLFHGNARKLLAQIRSLTGMMLVANPVLPCSICDRCKLDLDHAYQFRQRCLKSQEYFIEKLKYLPELQQNAELLLVVEKQEFINETVNVIPELLRLKNEPIFDVTTKTPQHSDSENNHLDDVSEIELTTKMEPLNNLNKLKKPIRTLKKQNIEITSPATSIKEVKLKEYICDQCGNQFKSRNHFSMHVLRHTGDKRFQCEICTDKFFTHSELKRHMRRHTGERPFVCKHCGRRFTDYSTRTKHERTHTNERPFACNQCSKAFTTSHILKNHMLTHTGERQFKCNTCDKTFQRQTHLDVHYRSMMHKQNAEKVSSINIQTTTSVTSTNITTKSEVKLIK